jgi:single-stranded-DNA-specific exonuclease
VLVARGLTAEDVVHRHLKPRLADLVPPAAMADMTPAVERLGKAVLEGEPIGIFGDYDVDGVTSTVLLGDFLRQSGAKVQLRVARRDEGYGFQESQARELDEAGCRVLVLVDCGTGDLPAVRLAVSAGIDVICVDHHRVADWSWPGLALINPHRPDCNYAYKGLASVGLCFNFAAMLRRFLEARGRTVPDPRTLLDLVALGTVADVAPLDGENRILVARGLIQLRDTHRPGLRELLKLCNLLGKVPSSDEVGWRLGPRLNAPGRLGDAAVSMRCLWEQDVARAVDEAHRCDSLNERRKEIQAEIFKQALPQAEAQASEGLSFIVVAGDGWHPGVIGIVASKLVDRFDRPAGVIALEGEKGRGSARSVPGVDLFAQLSSCSAHLLRYGGHRAAAGFSVRRDALDALRGALHEVTRGQLEGRPKGAGLDVDCLLKLGGIDHALCRELRRLAPHGHSNPEPIFAAEAVVVENTRSVGSDHLGLALRDGDAVVQAIGFGMLARRPAVGDRVDVAFVAEIDEYQGSPARVRLRLLDLRPAAATSESR